MVNSVFVILVVFVLQAAANLMILLWRMVKWALWLAVVPMWDLAVLSIAMLMWLCGGLAGAELPQLQMGQFGFLSFCWEDLSTRRYCQPR